jgi:hypothetical protein
MTSVERKKNKMFDAKQYSKDYVLKHKLDKKEYDRQYWKEHKKEKDEYKIKNKNLILKMQKKYREDNKSVCNARSRKYYNENKEYLNMKSSEWKNKNKVRVYALNLKRKNNIEIVEYVDKSTLLKLFNSVCAYCGKKLRNDIKTHTDNLLPVLWYENIGKECSHSYYSKHDRIPLEFMWAKEEMLCI